jgi:type IV secretory pathway TrbF-like protein
MWVRQTKADNNHHGDEAAEKLRYSRYYEHDGALQAYANRAMLLAFLCVPVALVALAFAVYVRIQPPTVIRVDEEGRATVLGKSKQQVEVAQGTGSEPTEFEKRAFVRLFLERYLNFAASNVSRNWAESLNMMTGNLRRTAYSGMQKDNLVGKVLEDQTSSKFQLRSLEAARDDPLSYTAFAVKEVHRLRDHNETTDKIVSELHIRLTVEKRSEQNPSGLLVGEYWERAIEGEKRNLILQQAGLSTVE